MANTSSSGANTESLEALVRNLPDDKVRLRLLASLAKSGGQARLVDLAREIEVDSSVAARTIVAAAKDGLVQFVDGNHGVRITGLGTKLATRQNTTTY